MINENEKEFEIIFEKNIKSNYVMIMGYDVDEESYEKKILENENINNILTPEHITIEEKEGFKYDIHAMTPLAEYLKTNKIKSYDIANLIKQINESFSTMENYLISEKSLMLDTKLIFLDNEKLFKKISFIVLPNMKQDISFELSRLLIRVLRSVDTSDKNTLNIAYTLFQVSQSDNYCIEDLLFSIKKQENELRSNYENEVLELDKEYAKDAAYEQYLSNKKENEYNIEDMYFEGKNADLEIHAGDDSINAQDKVSMSINKQKENVKGMDLSNLSITDADEFETIKPKHKEMDIFNMEFDGDLQIDQEDEDVEDINDEDVKQKCNMKKSKTTSKRKDSNKKSYKAIIASIPIKAIFLALAGILVPVCLIIIIFVE